MEASGILEGEYCDMEVLRKDTPLSNFQKTGKCVGMQSTASLLKLLSQIPKIKRRLTTKTASSQIIEMKIWNGVHVAKTIDTPFGNWVKKLHGQASVV